MPAAITPTNNITPPPASLTIAAAARPCSLTRYMSIQAGSMHHWHQLSHYHYRQHHPGIVDKIFTLQLTDRPDRDAWTRLGCLDDQTIGVIVYGMPMPNVALRNIATANRYVGWGDRAAALRLLNREIRCINRVVIRPEFRGMGLGRLLVAQTLPLAGTVLVEALAVMGRVNPFFERAGMTRYDSRQSDHAERLEQALTHLDIDPAAVADPQTLYSRIEQLPADQYRWLLSEMQRFAQMYRKDRSTQSPQQRLHTLCTIVASRLWSRPAYFIWKKPNATSASSN